MKIMIMADNKREGKYIQRQLKSYGYFAEVVLEGVQGIEKSIKNSYDLILLDRMDGMILCKEMRSKISVPVILMSVKDSIDDKVSGLDAGADDYIVKPFDIREVESRINAVLRRGNKETFKDMRFGEIAINLQKKTVTKNGAQVKFTIKEFLLLEYLISNKDRAVSRTEVISYLWGGDEAIFESDAKLDVYISNIRRKLRKDIIETIKGFGYEFREEA